MIFFGQMNAYLLWSGIWFLLWSRFYFTFIHSLWTAKISLLIYWANIYFALSTEFMFLHTFLCARVERVNVEVLMGEIGWRHVLTISGLFLPGLDWQHQLQSQSGIILRDTARIKHTTLPLINICPHAHVDDSFDTLFLPPTATPFELEACRDTKFLSHRNHLLNERSVRLDGYNFSWGWLVYFWRMSWILCNCCIGVVSKICCL